MDPRDFIFSNQQSQLLVKLPGTVNGQAFVLENLIDCEVGIFDHSDSIQVDDCKACRIIIGPTSGSVFFRDCSDCDIYVAAQQIRTRNCARIAFRVYCPAQPSIESSNSLSFAPWNVAFPHLNRLFVSAGLHPDTKANQWDKIYDFTPEYSGDGANYTVATEGEELQCMPFEGTEDDCENPVPYPDLAPPGSEPWAEGGDAGVGSPVVAAASSTSPVTSPGSGKGPATWRQMSGSMQSKPAEGGAVTGNIFDSVDLDALDRQEAAARELVGADDFDPFAEPQVVLPDEPVIKQPPIVPAKVMTMAMHDQDDPFESVLSDDRVVQDNAKPVIKPAVKPFAPPPPAPSAAADPFGDDFFSSLPTPVAHPPAATPPAVIAPPPPTPSPLSDAAKREVSVPLEVSEVSIGDTQGLSPFLPGASKAAAVLDDDLFGFPVKATPPPPPPAAAASHADDLFGEVFAPPPPKPASPPPKPAPPPKVASPPAAPKPAPPPPKPASPPPAPKPSPPPAAPSPPPTASRQPNHPPISTQPSGSFWANVLKQIDVKRESVRGADASRFRAIMEEAARLQVPFYIDASFNKK